MTEQAARQDNLKQTKNTNTPMGKPTPFHSFRGFVIHFGKHIDPQVKINFYQYLQNRKIPYYELANQEFDLKISEIIQKLEDKYTGQKTEDNKKITTPEATSVEENILFFSGMTRQEMEDYLAVFRDAKYPRFQLKAVATQTNQDYTFHFLLSEMRNDRTVISHLITLRNLLHQARKKLADNAPDHNATKTDLEKEMLIAEEIFRDVENTFDLQTCRRHIANLQKLLEKF